MTNEIRFTREDVTGVGDAAAAGTDAPTEAIAPEPPPPPEAETAAAAPTSEPTGASPASADRHASGDDGGRPEVAILGAFVGAFVAAKLLGKLGGNDD